MVLTDKTYTDAQTEMCQNIISIRYGWLSMAYIQYVCDVVICAISLFISIHLDVYLIRTEPMKLY